MQSQLKCCLALLSLFFGSVTLLQAQQQDLNVEVIVDMQQIPPDAQNKLVNFRQKVQDYLNKNKYHDEKIPPIKVQMQFSFTGLNLSTSNYEAKLFIASQREVYNPFKTGQQRFSTAFRFLDERCEFYFNDNLPFIKNDYRFDPFLSLLDYYAYVIVGFDEDSYYPKGGTRFFQKALDICNKVTSNAKGWTETGGGSKPSRMQLIQELLDVRFDNYRNGYFEYMWMGLDSLAINKPNAFRNILAAIDKISTVKKKEVKAYTPDIFFDSKATEIAEIFLDYGDRSIYGRLISMDPAHQAIYDEYRNRR
ncbi:MAG: DUF4835 family protein [Ignavibacteria bacterium]|nr:DUF4835 family protein [Ignavibacteria bacterium]